MGSRRAFLGGAWMAPAAMGLAGEEAARGEARGGDRIVMGGSNAVVETGAGRVRGYTRNGIHTFKGIPYGEDTGGKNRFMAPVRRKGWTGVRDTLAYGFACRQVHGPDWDVSRQHFVMDFEFGMMSEDCLQLNVWTRGLGDGGKRPVMFWIHGGGFSTGSSFELPCYDGENLAARGDVVVVSLNHRLNVLGFLDLAKAGGNAYGASANAGLLDIVLALEWVKENISRFGGDAGNVTVFGQSGGGAKINALMAMPKAKGLFHKAIVQSGSMSFSRMQTNSGQLAEEMFRVLGLKQGEVEKLQGLEYEQLVSAARTANDRIGKPVPGMPAGMGPFWGPTADGVTIAGAPAVAGGPRLDMEIPLLVGCTLNEISPSAYDETLEGITRDQLAERVKRTHGEKTEALLAAYAKEYPQAKPSDVLSMVESLWMGGGSLTQAREKAALGGAAAYAYRFDWNPAICDGRLRAFHALDMAFTFDNTDRWETATGGGERARVLAAAMSEAWIRFARVGNPNHRGLPEWPKFDSRKPVMVFNDVCELKYNPEAEIRRIALGE